MRGNRPRRSAFATISLLALALVAPGLFVTSARAACPNVTGTETTTQILADGDSCTVTGSGHIDVSGTPGANGIFGAGNNTVTIEAGGRITTNNAMGIDIGGDNNAIDNAGTISTSGLWAIGIHARDNNVIANNGTIGTGGRWAYGIYLNNNNTITNNGTITTSGDDAGGIEANNNNTITNNGTVGTSGDDANGIFAGYNNIITNGGIISTNGSGADGIHVIAVSTITNSGTISTSDFSATGIHAGTGNIITNSGTISTGGDRAYGISAWYDNIVTNSGTISTDGDRAYGIYARRDNTITNRGRVSSARSWGVYADGGGNAITNSGLIRGLLDPSTGATTGAISFAGTGNTLTLAPGSVLIGLVKLGDATAVNINTDLPAILYVDDLTHGTFDSLTHTIHQDAANSRVIAFSPELLEENSGGMSAKLVMDGVSGVLFGGDAATTVVAATAGDGPARRAAPNAPRMSMLAGSFLNRGKSKNPALWSTVYGGLMALRFHPSPGFLVGLHGGADRTKTKGGKSKSGWFGGVHARYENEGLWLAGLLTAGRAGAGGIITFLDNFSPTGYRAFALGGHTKFISAESRLGMSFAVPEAPMMSLSPELMARVTRVKNRVRVSGLPMLPSGGGKSTMFDGRAQLTAAFDLSTAPEQQVRLLLTSGVALHDEKGNGNDRVTCFGGLKLQMRTAENVGFFVGGEGHVGKGGVVGVAGNVGIDVRF